MAPHLCLVKQISGCHKPHYMNYSLYLFLSTSDALNSTFLFLWPGQFVIPLQSACWLRETWVAGFLLALTIGTHLLVGSLFSLLTAPSGPTIPLLRTHILHHLTTAGWTFRSYSHFSLKLREKGKQLQRATAEWGEPYLRSACGLPWAARDVRQPHPTRCPICRWLQPSETYPPETTTVLPVGSLILLQNRQTYDGFSPLNRD